MTNMEPIKRTAVEPDDVFVQSATLSFEDHDPESRVLRVTAKVAVYGDDRPIGRASGYIMRDGRWADRGDADAISGDCHRLFEEANRRCEADPAVENVFLLDGWEIDPGYRGNRLTGHVLTELVRLLFDSGDTVVACEPFPLGLEPTDAGFQTAKAKVELAYRDAGFETSGDGMWSAIVEDDTAPYPGSVPRMWQI